MKFISGVLLAGVFCAVLSGCGGGGYGGGMMGAGNPPAANAAFWAQWGANPQHAGMVNVAGQNASSKLVNIVYDPFVAQEQAEFNGDLVAHYQAPITDGTGNGYDVYMVSKTGQYLSCAQPGGWTTGIPCGPNAWNSMIWNEQRYQWQNGNLKLIWTYTTDWKPEPNGTDFSMGFAGLQGWEPVFHPVDANNYLYVPGANGSVWKLNKTSGTATSHIMPPLTGLNANAAIAYVSGPLTADSNGNIYYNVIALAGLPSPWNSADVAGAWLVKIAPDDTASSITYAALIPLAPPGTATCAGTFFDTSTLPWPPSANATPAPITCGSQRPGVNVAPAVGPDGTIYTVSRAHFDAQQAYMVAVKPDLSGAKWVTSFQNLLNDGCGTLLPIAGPGVTNLANSCRNGTTPGVDPTTNAKGSGVIADQASSSPTVLPDGVIFGTLDNYNYARGHLFKFDAAGNFVAAFTFGWDSTPGVYVHGGTYSIVIKDNHYSATAYCFDQNSPICQAVPPGPYYITQLDPNLNVEWQFQSTNIQLPNNPNGFEWCINMPAIDMNGNVYVNSEDGNIYVLPQGHNGVFTQPAASLFLNLALGAAYTPLSIGPDGKLYTQNDGHLFVVGN
jgi:hypothetical protein